MKRVFKNNRLIVIAFFTVFAVSALPAIAMAHGKNPEIPVELKLIGSIKNQPLFQLDFNGNADENEFIIIIKDDTGNSLYRENIKGEVFSKKFLVNTDEMGDSALIFEVVSRKTNKRVSFQVNNNHHVVEETVINKLN
jgi:hypothetical protein